MTVFGITRSSYFYAVRRREKKLRRLIDRLADVTQDLVGEPRRLLDD